MIESIYNKVVDDVPVLYEHLILNETWGSLKSIPSFQVYDDSIMDDEPLYGIKMLELE